MNDFLHWGISPVLINVGPIQIYWYGLLFAGGFFIGLQIMQNIFKQENKDASHIDSLLWLLVVTTVIGARLGHCLFYDPQYYWQNPMKIIAIWEGGLASHGGALGVLLGLYIFKNKFNYSYLWILDRVAIAAVVAGCFIRIGNFFNSEILGQTSNLPWAVVFTRVDLFPRHPAQLYEALSYASIFVLLWLLYKKSDLAAKPGCLFGIYLSTVFGARFFVEFIKQQQSSYSYESLLNTGQWLSLPFIVAGIVLIILSISSWKTVKI